MFETPKFSDYLMYICILCTGMLTWEMFMWVRGESKFMFWMFVGLVVLNTLLLKLIEISRKIERRVNDYEDETNNN